MTFTCDASCAEELSAGTATSTHTTFQTCTKKTTTRCADSTPARAAVATTKS